MKILQINKFHYLRGGSERYYFELAKILKENGHEVIFLSMQDDRNESSEYGKYFIEKVEVENFSIKNIIKFFYNYEAVKKLEQLIKDEKPDIAHLHNIAHQISPAIIKVLKKHKIPVVQTLHDYKLVCPDYQLFRDDKQCFKCASGRYYNCTLNKCVKKSWSKSLLATLEAYVHRSTYKKVDQFIAPSEYMKKVCIEMGISAPKIEVIYNFIDKITSASTTKSNQTNAENLDNSYLLYFGRISSEKGITVLLEAMKKIKQNLKLKIVGTGPEYLMIKKYVDEIIANGKNVYHSQKEVDIEIVGPKYGDELRNIIKGSKAVVIPSIWPENMPLSLLEAMLVGKPVIASRVGGMPEIIEDGKNGFLFSSGDSEELVVKIDELDKIDLHEIKKYAKKTIKGLRFDKNEHYKSILEIYQSLLK